LGGEPGVRSARYGGPGATDDDRNGIVLERLRRVEEGKRGARFIAAVAIAVPGENTHVVERSVEGQIAHERKGSNGFGYDPIFFYPPGARTFGELSAAEKDSVSHRGQALQQAAEVLSTLVRDGILT
jgi:XTP/dITP diphosphohydrolase